MLKYIKQNKRPMFCQKANPLLKWHPSFIAIIHEYIKAFDNYCMHNINFRTLEFSTEISSMEFLFFITIITIIYLMVSRNYRP